LKKALERLEKAGFNRRSVVVYTLFNYIETPEDFLNRVREITAWGAVSYPMRFEPLTSLTKNAYVSPAWSKHRLQEVAQFRRVMGSAGAIPPYEGLVKKINKAPNFDEAFRVRDKNKPVKTKSSRKKVARYGGDLDWRVATKPSN